jgi:DtxR family Mn-dependent transcriptional regulator
MANRAYEDYLRAFYYLEQKNGEARPSQLASYLGVSRPGVSEMLRYLGRAGMVRRRPYGKASLTSKGRSLARKMTFKNRVLESFMARSLRVPPSRVHAEACRLEHAISDDSLRRLYAALGRPKSDPHGQPIIPAR